MAKSRYVKVHTVRFSSFIWSHEGNRWCRRRMILCNDAGLEPALKLTTYHVGRSTTVIPLWVSDDEKCEITVRAACHKRHLDASNVADVTSHASFVRPKVRRYGPFIDRKCDTRSWLAGAGLEIMRLYVNGSCSYLATVNNEGYCATTELGKKAIYMQSLFLQDIFGPGRRRATTLWTHIHADIPHWSTVSDFPLLSN